MSNLYEIESEVSLELLVKHSKLETSIEVNSDDNIILEESDSKLKIIDPEKQEKEKEIKENIKATIGKKESASIISVFEALFCNIKEMSSKEGLNPKKAQVIISIPTNSTLSVKGNNVKIHVSDTSLELLLKANNASLALDKSQVSGLVDSNSLNLSGNFSICEKFEVNANKVDFSVSAQINSLFVKANKNEISSSCLIKDENDAELVVRANKAAGNIWTEI